MNGETHARQVTINERLTAAASDQHAVANRVCTGSSGG
jgi:hypothetical protein